LQDRLPKYLKLPIKENGSTVLEIELNQMPQILLKEGSGRIYANAILQASLFFAKLPGSIVANISFVPFFNSATGQLGVSQISVENIDMNILPKKWLDEATRIVNKMLPELFAKYIIYQFEKNWLLKIAKIVNLRTKVIDRRLEIIIL
jgi:hypothetical protein